MAFHRMLDVRYGLSQKQIPLKFMSFPLSVDVLWPNVSTTKKKRKQRQKTETKCLTWCFI